MRTSCDERICSTATVSAPMRGRGFEARRSGLSYGAESRVAASSSVQAHASSPDVAGDLVLVRAHQPAASHHYPTVDDYGLSSRRRREGEPGDQVLDPCVGEVVGT